MSESPPFDSRSYTLHIGQDQVLVRRAQALRYAVFYEELGAIADPATAARRLDIDAFDAIADHLVVVDESGSTPDHPHVVGCYRLIRGEVALAHSGFYSASEFDLGIFTPRAGEIAELGRSCVHPDHRNGVVMQLLWRGIARYLDHHGLTLMLGCASLPGTDVTRLAPSLAYLRRHFLAPPELRPTALPHRHVPLPDPATFGPIELQRGKAMLPPLLKAYLRMGGLIGDGAVVDEPFNTTDVCLVLPTERLADRYLRHLAAPRAGDAIAA